MMVSRPWHIFALALLLLAATDAALVLHAGSAGARESRALGRAARTAGRLGAIDLCFSTETPYTRHPAASDRTLPWMEHPGAMEHFPGSLFWAQPRRRPGP